MDVGHPCVLIQAYLTTWARWTLNLSFVGGWKWLGKYLIQKELHPQFGWEEMLDHRSTWIWMIHFYQFFHIKEGIDSIFLFTKDSSLHGTGWSCSPNIRSLFSPWKTSYKIKQSPSCQVGRVKIGAKALAVCRNELAAVFLFLKGRNVTFWRSKHQVLIGILHSCRFGGLG